MTNKEPIKCIKSFLPDENCYSCSSCMYYTESDCVGYGDKCYLKQAFNFLNKENPTLNECIKEWEDRGFEVRENTDHNLLFRHNKEDNVVEIFKRDLSYMYYPYFDDGTILSIPYDLHNLIHKTIKVLEEMKDE